MKKTILVLLVALTVILSRESLHAQFDPTQGCIVGPDGQCLPNTIITAVPFLRIVPDARSGGMGDAGIAISPDANAMHFNPSKLAFAEEDLGLSATYTPWLRALGLTDVYLAYLTGYKQLNNEETIGFGLRYFSLGDINFTNVNGQPEGTGRPREFEIALSYSRQLGEKLSAGISGKYIYSNLASGQQIGTTQIEAANAGAADISLTYKTDMEVSGKDTDLTIGFVVSNIGTKVSYTKNIDKDYIPANIGIGAAWDYHLDDFNTLTFALDINKLLVPTPCAENCDEDGDGTPDYKQQGVASSILSSFGDAPGGITEEFQELMYSVGVEYWYDKQFAVRAGYYAEHKLKGNRKFFTVGLGLKYNIFGLNLSYLVPTTNQRNPLDNTLRFSLLFDFAAFAADE